MTRLNKIVLDNKEHHYSSEESTTEYEKILTSHTSAPGLVSKLYNELKELKTKKTKSPIKMEPGDKHRIF